MEILDFTLPALKKRGGIYMEHSGAAHKPLPYRHNFYEMTYTAHGRGSHMIDGRFLTAEEGDIFITAPNTPHCFVADNEMEYIELYHCYFMPELIGTLWQSLEKNFPEDSDFFEGKIKYIRMKDFGSKRLRNIFIYMIDEFANSPAGSTDTLPCYLTILLTLIFREHRAAKNNPVFGKNKQTDEIIRYINYHIETGVTVREIAEANHLSEAYLCRMFKKHTGMTIIEYINKMKIDYVKDLLKNTDRSTESMAEYINCSLTYLRRLFKKHTGMSMSAYREKYHYKK